MTINLKNMSSESDYAVGIIDLAPARTGRGECSSSGFGEALRRVRSMKGLTQKQLGDAAGVHANTIAKLERGEQEPAWPLVLKFTAALGVTCEAFSGLEGVKDGEPEKPTPKKKGGKKG